MRKIILAVLVCLLLIPAVGAWASPDGGIVPATEDNGYIWPAKGFNYISATYTEKHPSIDITGQQIEGTKVLAAHAGTVDKAYYSDTDQDNYGIYCRIANTDRPGYATLYAQMSQVLVKPGDTIKAGQVIGYVGKTGNSTGPHLHFETWYQQTRYNPLNEFPDFKITLAPDASGAISTSSYTNNLLWLVIGLVIGATVVALIARTKKES